MTKAKNSLQTALLLLAGLVVSPVTISQAADAPPAVPASEAAKFTIDNTARENPKSSIAEAARTLEAKQYRLFVENFMPPEKFKELKPESLDDLLKHVERDAESVSKLLRHCSKLELTIEGDKAVHEFKEPIQIEFTQITIPRIVMLKIGNYWYLGQ